MYRINTLDDLYFTGYFVYLENRSILAIEWSVDDLYFTGFFDYLENGSILAIEWSENIANYLPENTITVELKRLDETTREITIDGDERF